MLKRWRLDDPSHGWPACVAGQADGGRIVGGRRAGCVGWGRADHVVAQCASAMYWGIMVAKINVDVSKVISMYKGGASVLSIANTLGHSRNVIERRITEAGLPLRTASEANKLRMANLTPDERQKLSRAAHEAVKGSTRRHESLVCRAMDIQRRAKVSKLEQLCHQELALRGVSTIPLMAIDKYNVDLGFLAGKVAIEVHCNFHTEQRKAVQDARKLCYLAAAEWWPCYLHEKTLSAFTFDTLASICKFRASFLAGSA